MKRSRKEHFIFYINYFDYGKMGITCYLPNLSVNVRVSK